MSGPKRTPINRPRKAASYDNTVALFAALEKTPMARRNTEVFKAREDDLHWRLGIHYKLGSAPRAFSIVRKSLPTRAPPYVAHHEWFKVHAIRLELLETAGLSAKKAG